MDQQQKRRDYVAGAAKSRGLAQERRDAQVAEVAGKQAQLKHEAQERREKKPKTSVINECAAAPGRLRKPPRICPSAPLLVACDGSGGPLLSLVMPISRLCGIGAWTRIEAPF